MISVMLSVNVTGVQSIHTDDSLGLVSAAYLHKQIDVFTVCIGVDCEVMNKWIQLYYVSNAKLYNDN